MSTTKQLDAALTKRVQTKLKEAGVYFGEIDGNIGPKSRAAARAWVPTADTHAVELDPRSNSWIFGGITGGATVKALHPNVRPLAAEHIKLLRLLGIDARVISGYRTYAEQDAIYNRHDGSTNARGGQSNHNFAAAFDIGLFVDEDCIPDANTSDDKYVEESGLYLIAGEIGMKLGLDWGGLWKSIKDYPHFQLRPGWAAGLSESKMLAGMRERVAQGKDIFK